MDVRDSLQSTLGDHYTVTRELGGGGMSRVFVAHDRTLDRDVVVKVLPPELAGQIEAERFRREIAVAARLQHPHIVPLHSASETGDLLYYTMPFVSGESLRARLDRERQLPVADAVQIGREVCDALAFAHAQGVVHRDIKPDNILLQGAHALVADFGIARAVATAGADKLTRTGVIVGTPSYMSPEQIAAEKDIDARTDIYALGCVLFEMLLGMPPFLGASMAQLAARVVNAPVPSLRTERPAIPEALEAVVQRALAKLPGDRYQSAAEMGEALAQLSAADAPRRVSTSKRRWLAAGASAVVVVAAVTAGVVMRRSPAIASDKPQWVLVADFMSPPTDSALGDVVRDIVSNVIDASRPLASVARSGLLDARRAAMIPDSARLTEERARHLAARTDVHVVLDGRIDRLAQDSYAITLRAHETQSDRVIASQAGTTDAPGIIAAAQKIARDLTASLRKVTVSSVPQEELDLAAATPSLEAYEEWLNGNARRAVEIDTGFAWAWSALAEEYFQTGRFDSSRVAYSHALASANRLTPAQRLLIEARMARELDHDFERSVRLLDQAAAGDPGVPEIYFWRAYALRWLGRYDEAIENFKHAMVLSPRGVNLGVLDLAATLACQGRVEEARQYMTSFSDSNEVRSLDEFMEIATGNWDASERAERRAIAKLDAAPNGRAQSVIALASAQAARGRLAEANQTLARVASYDETSELNLANLPPLMIDVFAGRSIPPGQDARLPRRTRPNVVAAWRAFGRNARGARALEDTLRSIHYASAVPLIEAEIAWRSGAWNDVIRHVAVPAWAGARFDNEGSITLARWLVADAYEHLGRPDSAVGWFDLLAKPVRVDLLEALNVGFAVTFADRRAALLYTKMGKPELAKPHWENVARNFSHADAELQPMVAEARRALQGSR